MGKNIRKQKAMLILARQILEECEGFCGGNGDPITCRNCSVNISFREYALAESLIAFNDQIRWTSVEEELPEDETKLCEVELKSDLRLFLFFKSDAGDNWFEDDIGCEYEINLVRGWRYADEGPPFPDPPEKSNGN